MLFSARDCSPELGVPFELGKSPKDALLAVCLTPPGPDWWFIPDMMWVVLVPRFFLINKSDPIRGERVRG